jgi:hypothetical protein
METTHKKTWHFLTSENECLTPKRIGRLTVGRNTTLIWLWLHAV